VSFFDELKRRNVFRVAIAYVIVAWLTIQVIDVLVPMLTLPEFIGRALILVLIVGFPVALIFAWAFELTPEGIKKEREVDRSESITDTTGRKLNFLIIGVLSVGLLMFAVDKFVLSPDRVETQTAATGDISIAVLPFADMSPEKDQEYFSDGITEEILNDLAKLKTIKVAGRTSSFAFKGRNEDLREIGMTLGVQNVLEGSVRKDGNTLRITAQLIKVSDGFHVWSETYDRELSDIFKIQDEISAAIVKALQGNLLGASVEAKPTRQIDLAIYEKYLLARSTLSVRSNKTLIEARRMLEEIVEAEPEFAPAYAALAETIVLLREGFSSYGDIPSAEADALATPLINKALELDPELAEAYAVKGLMLYDERQWDEAEVALLRAVELNPSLSNAWTWLSNLSAAQNRMEESLGYLEEASAIDPLWMVPNSNILYRYQSLGRYEDMWPILDRLRPFHESSALFHNTAAHAYASVGELAKALRSAETAYDLNPNTPTIGMTLTFTRMRLQEFDLGLTSLPEQFAMFRPFITGEWDTVLPLLRDALDANSLQPQLLFPYLTGLFQIGDTAAVAQYYDDHIREASVLRELQSEGLIILLAMAMDAEERQADKTLLIEEYKTSLYEKEANRLAGVEMESGWATYYAIVGDADTALARLKNAVDLGLRVPDWDNFNPEFEGLLGHPEYAAIKQQHLEAINIEREKIGWEPVATVGLSNYQGVIE
jgi:TolB-like protein